MKKWLMLGWVSCPNCLCRNPVSVSWRFSKFKRTRCMCCKKAFWFTRENFREERVYDVQETTGEMEAAR